MPLIVSVTLGVLACLAGFSFFLPSRMSIRIKAPIAASCALLGATYFYLIFFPTSEDNQSTIFSALIAAIVVSILLSNTGSYIIARMIRQKIKRAGLERRHG